MIRPISLCLLLQLARFSHATPAMEGVVSEWLALRAATERLERQWTTEHAVLQAEIRHLEHERTEIKPRLDATQTAAAQATENTERIRAEHQEALETLQAAEERLAAIWSRVPPPHRSPSAPASDSPEARAAALRHDARILARLHRTMLRGRDLVDSPEGRRYCDVLTLGLAVACALSDDHAFAATARPRADGPWTWTPAPERRAEIQALFEAEARERRAGFPMTPSPEDAVHRNPAHGMD